MAMVLLHRLFRPCLAVVPPAGGTEVGRDLDVDVVPVGVGVPAEDAVVVPISARRARKTSPC